MEPLNTDDPHVVGPFELLARLGAGGMGVAYLARRIVLEGLTDEVTQVYNLIEPDGVVADDSSGLVVVKMIQPSLLDGDPKVRKRFGREIEAVRAVIDERVPALVAFQEDPTDDRPWFAMDYIAGPSLQTMVEESGTFGVGPYAALGLALVDALRAIHGAGLLHRDLKPGNVVLGPDGPVVLDFGLAVLMERTSGQVLTKSGTGLGTPAYMPLEQLKNAKHVDKSADVYSLGATLFFALTGRKPYEWMPLPVPPAWDGVEAPFLPLLAQILVPAPGQRPDLDAVEMGLRALLAEADLTPELADQQLKALVEAADLVPKLPDEALDDDIDPAVQEQLRQALDPDSDEPGLDFYGIDPDEIEWAAEEADHDPQADPGHGGQVPDVPVPPEPPAQAEPAEPAPQPSPGDEDPFPASYRPSPRRRSHELVESSISGAGTPPRAAREVADRLRKAYAHRGIL